MALTNSLADWLGVSWRQAHSEAHGTLSGIDRYRCACRPAGPEYGGAHPQLAVRASQLADLCYN
ncbi:hypothetical protein PENARI_c167G08418, partial [Penicillium arizonense]